MLKAMIRATFSAKSCIMCDNLAYEDIRHVVMQCSAQSDLRREMYREIHTNVPASVNMCNFGVLMGSSIDGWDCNDMLPIWLISCTYIVRMYYKVIRFRNRQV